MFCLRSWLPLLFIPTNASPLFVIQFFLLSYFSNRPCLYCSILLLILFLSSCNWSDSCFFDFTSDWFEPRHVSSTLPNPLAQVGSCTGNQTEGIDFVVGVVNDTAAALAGAAVDELRRRITAPKTEWTGIGIEWFRSWLGAREMRIPCVDVTLRL